MKFSYNWLKELAGFKESPEKLAEFLNMRAFEIESVTKISNDWALDIKLPSNRYADASGHIGIAKEIALFAKSNVKSSRTKLSFPPSKLSLVRRQKLSKNLLNITIENPDDCPRYTALVMTNVKVGESPKWMREHLETCGLQPINNLVDAANYVMLEWGQPLHVFDMPKLKSKNEKVKIITVRRAKKGEKLHALDERIYELSPEILVIADEKEPIAVAGIKGGKESGVSADTKSIVLEAANFAPTVIRRGSKNLGLKTDASLRFEHGLDPNQTDIAIERLVALIQEIAGGDILQKIDEYPKPVKTQKVLFRPDSADRLLGVKIKPAQYEKFLAQLGFTFQNIKDGLLTEIPTNRPDLTLEEDLIEEVARLLGYENIPAVMPEAVLLPPAANEELFWENRVKDFLSASEFTESLIYEFTGDKELDKFFARRDNLLELENPTSPETQYLAPRILYKYLASVAENLRNFEQIKIFGIGKSFTKNQEPPPARRAGRIKNQGITEKKDLIIAAAKKGSTGEGQFYQLKGALDQLFESLGVSDHWYDDVTARAQTPRDKFHPYRFAEIKVGDEKIGHIGEIHPAVLENIKSKARMVAAEIDFEKLWRRARSEAEYKPLSRFPAVIRDIAVIVPVETRTTDVENIIQSAGGELLADTDLFDYFQDERIREKGEKSLAFHLIFQSAERTLRDEEVEKLIYKITASLAENGWEVRK